MKVLEAGHGSRQSFDASMILFNDLNQIFTLTDFDSFLIVSVKLFQAPLIGSALINVDQTWFAVFPNRFLQKAKSGFGIDVWRSGENQSSALAY